MAITVLGAPSVFCSASDHDTAANANAMNTTPIHTENHIDFPGNTERMAPLLPDIFRIMDGAQRRPSSPTDPTPGLHNRRASLTHGHTPKALAENDNPLVFIPRFTA